MYKLNDNELTLEEDIIEETEIEVYLEEELLEDSLIYGTEEPLTDNDIKFLVARQIHNDIEIHKTNVIMFGLLISLIVVIAFFKGMMNNAT